MHDLVRQLDESSRRAFLAYAAKIALGVTLLPPAFAAGAPGDPTVPGTAPMMKKKALCDSVIFLYMRGGMSQIDTFDPKQTTQQRVPLVPSPPRPTDCNYPTYFLN